MQPAVRDVMRTRAAAGAEALAVAKCGGVKGVEESVPNLCLICGCIP